MSSPITLSGFNNIDFGAIVDVLMQQASIPLTLLQDQQSQLTSRQSKLGTLTTYVSDVRSAGQALTSSSTDTAITVSDETAVSVSGTGSSTGHYDIVVQELARAQVIATDVAVADSDTTVVATGGTLTVGGVDVNITGSVTLGDLASEINGTSGIGVSASVVQTGANAYKLVLTGAASGVANAFTLTNSLTGGTGISFTDTDMDGTSGDDAADNLVQASDASVLINNLAITSSSNTLTQAIPGVSLTLLKKDPAATISVDVGEDSSALKTKVEAFIAAYNTLEDFTKAQVKAAGEGDTSSIGYNPALRAVRSEIRSTLSASYATGGMFSYLAEIGVEFATDGHLQLDDALFDAAAAEHPDEIAKLFVANGGTDGVFTVLDDAVTIYTQAGGVLPAAEQGLTSQLSRLADRILQMEDRLALQRTTLQQDFAAADMIMARLQAQSGSLQSFSTSLTSF